jgi:alkylation response protein AidB-like acyl-CoA dehydrogenase
VFIRSQDQQLLEETTTRFLETECPLDRLRELAALPDGYDESVWQRGAELGWTSLLVPEELGGGSVSEHGVLDLALVAYQFGLHAAPGPLLGGNVVAAAIGRWGSAPQQAGPLQELLSGQAAGAWATFGTEVTTASAESSASSSASVGEVGTVATVATETDDGFELEGVASPVEGGAGAAYILVTARTGSALSLFLVPRGTEGMRISRLQSLDMTKRFARLEFDRVRVPRSALVGTAGQARPVVGWLADLAVSMQVAEMCGAMRWALETTLEWAGHRYSFGRPLASYQEVKHRFADMKLWLEASHAIAATAADAVDRDAPNRSELVSAAKFYTGRFGPELVQDCVQLHGGIGITFDHHLHLFLRRVATNTPLFGTPGDHATRLTDLYEANMSAA